MKLSGVRDNYYFHSGKVSDINRQMSLAAIALVWVFKLQQGTQVKVPNSLIPAAALVVLGMTFDFLQYVSSTLIWGIKARNLEKQDKRDEDEVMLPDWINYPALIFFWVKIPMTVGAYVVLIRFLYSNLR